MAQRGRMAQHLAVLDRRVAMWGHPDTHPRRSSLPVPPLRPDPSSCPPTPPAARCAPRWCGGRGSATALVLEGPRGSTRGSARDVSERVLEGGRWLTEGEAHRALVLYAARAGPGRCPRPATHPGRGPGRLRVQPAPAPGHHAGHSDRDRGQGADAGCRARPRCPLHHGPADHARGPWSVGATKLLATHALDHGGRRHGPARAPPPRPCAPYTLYALRRAFAGKLRRARDGRHRAGRDHGPQRRRAPHQLRPGPA